LAKKYVSAGSFEVRGFINPNVLNIKENAMKKIIFGFLLVASALAISALNVEVKITTNQAVACGDGNGGGC
jgi:hypothetical protein